MGLKEQLRKALGKFGDYNVFLERDFGSAYLRGPDDPQEIPDELQIPGLAATNVTKLIQRAVDQAPQLSHEVNQAIIMRHIYGGNVSADETWATFAHLRNCDDDRCHALDNIACMDKYGDTSEDMIRAAKRQKLL